jgi:hypothetical protein
VAALKEKGFASAEQALTGRTARVQGSVFLFSDGGVNTLVGEIYWFASVGSELVVGFSTWPVRKNCGIYRKVRVVEDFSIIPSARGCTRRCTIHNWPKLLRIV